MEKYTVEKQLGAGNYGECSLVRSKKSGTQYALKRIDLSTKSPAQQKEAENEVKTMSKLNHPNIIQFVEAFVEHNALCIVMEFADGSDLEHELIEACEKRRYISEDRIMSVFVQIALGLRQLHKQHLLHRDLKSANVFLTSTGAVKLGDFGFAKQLNYTMALASTVCGTPYYFSPELCQRLPYNNKSDVWSLGVILYEMINLQKPFEAKNLPELRKRVVTEEPAPFTATHVSAELKELCMLLLRKSSAARPSVDAVLQTPFVRKYLAKFAEQLQKMQAQQAERVASLAAEHPRKATDPSYEQAALSPPVPQPVQGVNDTKNMQKGVFDRAAFLKAQKQGTPLDDNVLVVPTVHTTIQAQAQQQNAAQSTVLFNRESTLPDARKVVSNNCPITVVAELTTAMTQEQDCKALQNDLKEVMSSFEVEDVIGEAESDEERMLREELGDQVFARVIELALRLQECEHGPRADATYKELLAKLGSKQYLLADVQRVASFFEVDPGSQ